MPVVIGAWFALVGALAALAGLTARQRARQLRKDGVPVWAMAVPGRDPGPVHLRYSLPDGRVLESRCPAAFRKPSLYPGEKILAWYDPQDPREVIVYGRDGQVSDRVFMVAGALLMLAGAGIAIL